MAEYLRSTMTAPPVQHARIEHDWLPTVGEMAAFLAKYPPHATFSPAGPEGEYFVIEWYGPPEARLVGGQGQPTPPPS